MLIKIDFVEKTETNGKSLLVLRDVVKNLKNIEKTNFCATNTWNMQNLVIFVNSKWKLVNYKSVQL